MKSVIKIIMKIARKLRGDWAMEKTAQRIIKYRLPLLITSVLITLFFAYQITNLKIDTNLEDLLPQQHRYIKLHNEFKEVFGGTNVLFVMVSVKNGDIFTPETLGKLRHISEELMFVPGMDRYKVISIAQRKVKDIRSTSWGLQVSPLMWPEVPKTDEGMEKLKQAIYTNDVVYGPLVSFDKKHALIMGEFFEKGVDYRVIFNEVKKICDPQKDENTDIAIAGEAMIRGYIYSYLGETRIIFGVTVLFMFLLLLFYSRNLQKTFLPLLSALLSAIWGLGFIGLKGYELDPLILVVPFLISARTLSHSIQFNERFDEELRYQKDVNAACQAAIVALFVPGLAGIVTDAAGIAVLVLIPIPVLQKLGVFCVFWAMTTIITVLINNPIILSYITPRQKAEEPEEAKKKAASPGNELSRVFDSGLFERTLSRLQYLNVGGRSWGVLIVTLIIALLAWIYASRLVIGDVHPGTPLLKSDSAYNKDAKLINEVFMGLDPLRVVFKGVEGNPMYQYEALHHMEQFQRYVEKNSSRVGGSLSIVDILKRLNSTLHQGLPKYMKIPNDTLAIGQLYFFYLGGSEPGDLDMYETYDNRHGNITVFVKDHRAETIREIIALYDQFVATHSIELGRLEIAGGVIGTLAAANEQIGKYEALLLALTLLAIVVLCSISFRSILAGILLLIPLVISNYFVFAYMGLQKIGLNINTLPVATIAIGIGVDYGIYLYSRLREEYRRVQNLFEAYVIALITTCKAITFTALTVAVGVVFWSFSNIKFQAEMGLLLTIVTFFHLLGTLILLPALVLIIKPKFITEIKD